MKSVVSARRILALLMGLVVVGVSLTACAPSPTATDTVPTATDVWIKAVPDVTGEMTNMTGMFGVFSNPTDEVVYILGGTAIDTALTTTKLDAHEVVKTAAGKMEMQEVKTGIPIPAHGSVTLKPGGFHVMFWDLKKPIEVGAEVRATINFSNGTSLDVSAVSRDIANYAG